MKKIITLISAVACLLVSIGGCKKPGGNIGKISPDTAKVDRRLTIDNSEEISIFERYAKDYTVGGMHYQLIATGHAQGGIVVVNITKDSLTCASLRQQLEKQK